MVTTHHDLLTYPFKIYGSLSVRALEQNQLEVTNLESTKRSGIFIQLAVGRKKTYQLKVDGYCLSTDCKVYLWFGDISGTQPLYYQKIQLPQSIEKSPVIAHYNVGTRRRVTVGIMFDRPIPDCTFILHSIVCTDVKRNVDLISIIPTPSNPPGPGLPLQGGRGGGTLPQGVRGGVTVQRNIMENNRLIGFTMNGTDFRKHIGVDIKRAEHGYKVTRTSDKSTPGIMATVNVASRKRYVISLTGLFQSRTNKLYLWVASVSTNKVIAYKEIGFESDLEKQVTFKVGSKKNSALKVGVLFKGDTLGVGDSFYLSDFTIEPTKRKVNIRENAILIIADFRRLKTHVALNRYKFIQYIKKHRSDVFLFGTDHPKYRAGMRIQNVVNMLKIRPRIIVHLNNYMGSSALVSGLGDFRCKKAYLIEDMHKSDVIGKMLKHNKMKYVIYRCKSGELKPIMNYLPDRRFIHLPHYVDTEIYRNYESEKNVAWCEISRGD